MEPNNDELPPSSKIQLHGEYVIEIEATCYTRQQLRAVIFAAQQQINLLPETESP